VPIAKCAEKCEKFFGRRRRGADDDDDDAANDSDRIVELRLRRLEEPAASLF
jgi:hypothetical protein